MEFGNLQMYIDGDMKSSVDNLTKDIFSPLNGQKIASLAWGNQKDSLLALESASKGFKVWSKLPLTKRKEWMSMLREKILENEVLLRKAISYEMGKPYSATAEDIESITNSLEYYADVIDDFVKTEKIAVNDETHNHKLVSKPIGVVVALGQQEGRVAFDAPVLLPDEEFVGLELIRGRTIKSRQPRNRSSLG